LTASLRFIGGWYPSFRASPPLRIPCVSSRVVPEGCMCTRTFASAPTRLSLASPRRTFGLCRALRCFGLIIFGKFVFFVKTWFVFPLRAVSFVGRASHLVLVPICIVYIPIYASLF
ncbi:hypothetical protein B0H13DRAFT_1972948, partial [Mycena leptocephala]